MVRCLERPPEEWPTALEDAMRDAPGHAAELCARMRLVGVELEAEAELGPPVRRLFELPWRLGDFTCVERLGSGGMGIVFRARQESLGRDVALKVVRPERLLFEGSLTRFQREVETVARLEHAGIVKIHTVARPDVHADELPYFAMELLRGATLAEVLDGLAGRAPESLDGLDLFEAVGGVGEAPPMFHAGWVEAALHVAIQVADALQHAHTHGVLHRDVKPSNILLEPSGRAVLIDFGLTATHGQTSSRLTASGQPVGTLVYMSPEQIEGHEELDARTDLYSLGVTLYELLALQAPFEGATATALQQRIQSGKHDALRARSRSVSRDVEVVVAKALATSRGDRYPSARAFADDLQRVLSNRPILAKPPGIARVSALWARRHPAVAVAGLAGFVALVGVPSAYLVLERRHRGELERLVVDERAARVAAVEARAEVEDVLGFVLGLFEHASPDAPSRARGGDVPDAVELLHLGATEVAELDRRPSSKARIQLALGGLFSALAEPAAAQPALDAALEHYRARVARADVGGDREARVRYAEGLRLSGHNLLFLRRVDEADTQLREALTCAEGVYGRDAVELHPFRATLADLAQDRGDHELALRHRREALEVLQRAGIAPNELRCVRLAGLIGSTLKELGRYDEARPILERAVAYDEAADGALGAERDLFELVLADMARLEGDLPRALALASSVRERLAAARGPDSLLTLQAALCVAETLGQSGHVAEALPILAEVSSGMATRVPVTHPMLLRARVVHAGALLAAGRAAEVRDHCAVPDLLALVQAELGASHSLARSLLRTLSVAQQVSGDFPGSLRALTLLQAAEREVAPWSGTHCDAVLMLVGHRMQMGLQDERDGPAASEALLTEMVEGVGPAALPVTSSTNGQTYEAGTMARVFLAGVIATDPARREEAAALNEAAEARRREVQRAETERVPGPRNRPH